MSDSKGENGRGQISRVAEERRVLYREVNDRIVGLGGFADGEQVLVLCECGSPSCEDRIELSKDEYQALRAFPARFVVAGDHSNHGLGRVVEQRAGFAVVEI
jgi:hypothetical protein